MPAQSPRSGPGVLVLGAVVLALLGAGWFVLSHFVMDTAASDAIGEALGVMLGAAGADLGRWSDRVQWG